jgi:hypothetical protein
MMEAGKPIVITLLTVLPMVLVVTMAYFWWQRHVSPSLVRSYRMSWLGFWILLAFGPLSVWLFLHEKRPDYWIWGMIAVQWVVGILRGIPKLRDYRRRLAAKP